MARRFYVSPVKGSGTWADPQRAAASDLVRNASSEILVLATGKVGKSYALVAVDDASDDVSVLDNAPGHMAFPIDLAMPVGDLPPNDLRKAQTFLGNLGIPVDDLVPGSATTVGDLIDRVGTTLNPTYAIDHHFVVGA